jgi:hypothetical protein
MPRWLLGSHDPAHPHRLHVTIHDGPATCGDPQTRRSVRLRVDARGSWPLSASGVYVDAPEGEGGRYKGVLLAGTAEVTAVPTADQPGTIELSLSSNPIATTDVSIRGTLPLTLCPRDAGPPGRRGAAPEPAASVDLADPPRDPKAPGNLDILWSGADFPVAGGHTSPVAVAVRTFEGRLRWETLLVTLGDDLHCDSEPSTPVPFLQLKIDVKTGTLMGATAVEGRTATILTGDVRLDPLPKEGGRGKVEIALVNAPGARTAVQARGSAAVRPLPLAGLQRGPLMV